MALPQDFGADGRILEHHTGVICSPARFPAVSAIFIQLAHRQQLAWHSRRAQYAALKDIRLGRPPIACHHMVQEPFEC